MQSQRDPRSPPPPGKNHQRKESLDHVPTRVSHSRRTSTASSITTLGGLRETHGHPQSLGISLPETRSNSLYNLLKPPAHRTGLNPSSTNAARAPTTRDITPVTLPNINIVDNNVFTPYLKEAGRLYEAIDRARESAEPARPTVSRKSSRSSINFNAALPPTPSVLSEDTFVNGFESPRLQRRVSGTPRRLGPTAAPLSTIPTVYLEEDFHLENPRTFDIVSEHSEILANRSVDGQDDAPEQMQKKHLAANAILQEKLSWYMDTVEIHLLSAISNASTSFFTALGSLRSLHSDAEASLEKLKGLRKTLAELDAQMASGGNLILDLKRKQRNLTKLRMSMHQLEAALEALSSCEKSLKERELHLALQSLNETAILVGGVPEDVATVELVKTDHFRNNLVDLSRLKVLAPIGDDLAILRKQIGKAFEAEFVQTLMSDLRRHIENISPTVILQRWDRASNRQRYQNIPTPTEMPAYMRTSDEIRDNLRRYLQGLSEAEAVSSAMSAYKEAMLKELKNIIRRQMPSSTDDDAASTTSVATHASRGLSREEKSTVLVRNLRSLDAEDAEAMLSKIYINAGEGLRRLSIQVKMLLDVTSTLAGGPSDPRSPRTPATPFTPGPSLRPDEVRQVLDLSGVVSQAVDAVQIQVVKILTVRSEQSVNMDMEHFVKYFTINRLFADECEAISGRGGIGHKNIVNDNIKAYVAKMLGTEKQDLIARMDTDQFEVKTFERADQERLDNIITASTQEVKEWTKDAILWETNGTVALNGQAQDSKAQGDSSTKALPARLEEQDYLLPDSAITALRGIEKFERLLSCIPGIGADASNALLDYLRLFNSRLQQLILGAGAIMSAGLKTITTKHLALSMQSLTFLTTLMPYLREFSRRHLPASSPVLAEFDRTKRSLQEHQSGLQEKLVEIMTGRSSLHLATMREIDWSKEASSDAANPYMETLVKETLTLHRNLTRYVNDIVLQSIMRPILARYTEQWVPAFTDATVKSAPGKERMLRDAEFFRNRMAKIEDAEPLGKQIVDIVEAKVVSEK